MHNELVLIEIVMMTYVLSEVVCRSMRRTTEILIRSGTLRLYYNFKGPLRYVFGRVVTQSV
jgi:hypothetical protein